MKRERSPYPHRTARPPFADAGDACYAVAGATQQSVALREP